MQIIPYGGVNEIGGNAIFLETDKIKMLLDFGRSFKREGTYFSGFLQPRTSKSQGLADFFEFDILPKIPGLYAPEFLNDAQVDPQVEAVFISHAHLDHFGNSNLIHDDIPIFMGETAATVIQSIQDTTRTRFGRQYIRQPTDGQPSNVRTFRTGDVLQFNNIEITPVHVDHSLPGAYGFIIEDLKNGVTIGYSGDIRLHGFRKDLSEDFIKISKKKSLDALIMEGTNVNEEFDSNEAQVQQDISQALSKTNGLAIANYSLRDIDRFRSFFLAAKENGRKLLINTKQAYLLQLLQEDPHLDIPSLNDPNLQVYKRPKKRYYKWEQGIFEDHSIIDSPAFDQLEYVFHCDFWNLTDLIDIKPRDSTFFYSHGDPFDEEGMIDFNRMQEWIKHFKLNFKQYHASGHAPRKDLKQIIDTIDPSLLIPVHSEHPEMYKSLVDVPILLPTRGRPISIGF